MKVFINGLMTGLVLQLAVGPVFFFIVNLVLQRTTLDGFAGVLAVTLVDYFYISLAIFGIGKLLENGRAKKTFGLASSIVLVYLGALIIMGAVDAGPAASLATSSSNLFSSFISVFAITISSPMTIIFFTSLFTAKAVEYNYTKNDLLVFGLGTGFATFLFMGASVIIFSLVRGSVPLALVQALNIIVGCLLVGYGGTRLVKIFTPTIA